MANSNSKPLLIVESPSKAKTISKYLGGEYNVIASVGHIKDLPRKEIGIDIENDFSMAEDVLEDKKEFVKELRSMAKVTDKVVIATDPDREGEAISWHVLELLNDKKIKLDIPVERVVFHEITNCLLYTSDAADE